jgi:hypothetical protein
MKWMLMALAFSLAVSLGMGAAEAMQGSKTHTVTKTTAKGGTVNKTFTKDASGLTVEKQGMSANGKAWSATKVKQGGQIHTTRTGPRGNSSHVTHQKGS